MKIGILSWSAVLNLSAAFAGPSRAEDDARIMGKFGRTLSKDHMRSVSLYLSFKGEKAEGLPALPSGRDTRAYAKVWEDLYLQATTQSGEKGTAGYLFSFSKDEGNKSPVVTKESRDVPTLREVSVSDFRTEDNFAARTLKTGVGTPEDRGALRVIHYDGFDVEIRVLEFNIGDAQLKKKPFFKYLSCLVTVTETR